MCHIYCVQCSAVVLRLKGIILLKQGLNMSCLLRPDCFMLLYQDSNESFYLLKFECVMFTTLGLNA